MALSPIMRPLARLCLVLTALLAPSAPAWAEVASFPAPVAGGREMSIYSSLDTDLAAVAAEVEQLQPQPKTGGDKQSPKRQALPAS